MFLEAEVPLAYLLSGVLPVAKGEMVLDMSELPEKKGTIPPESVTLEEGEVLLFFGASLVVWYSWGSFFSVDWTGGHR
jgi:hypothetical protein